MARGILISFAVAAICVSGCRAIGHLSRLGRNAGKIGRGVGKVGQGVGRVAKGAGHVDDPIHRLGQLGRFQRNIHRVGRIGNIAVQSSTDLAEGNPWRLLRNEELLTTPLRWADDIKLPARIKNPRVFAIIPDNEASFLNVFGRPGSTTALKEMRKAKSLFDRMDRAKSLTEDTLTKDGLFSLLRQEANSNTVVVIAHSEEAAGATRAIRLPNGESVPIEELHQVALVAKKRCMVLTCHGSDFGINTEVGLRDAYEMINRTMTVQEAYANVGMAADDFVRSVRVHRYRIQARRVAINCVATGSGGSGVFIVRSRFKGEKSEKADRRIPNSAKSVEAE